MKKRPLQEIMKILAEQHLAMEQKLLKLKHLTFLEH